MTLRVQRRAATAALLVVLVGMAALAIMASMSAASASSAQGEELTSTTDVFIAEHDVRHGILRHDSTSGSVIDDLGSTAPDLDAAFDVAFGPDGLLYVSDSSTNTVERFNIATDSHLDTFISSETASMAGLDHPTGLAFSPAGDLLVASGRSGDVLRFDGTTGAFISTVTADEHRLRYPVAIAVDSNGDQYVADAYDDDIELFSGSTGEHLGTFATFAPGASPSDIVFTDTGDLIVALEGAGQLVVLSDEGDTRELFTDDLETPSGIALGPDGAVWVTDYWNDSIQRFDVATGDPLDTPHFGDTLHGPRQLTFFPSDPPASDDDEPSPVTEPTKPLTAEEWTESVDGERPVEDLTFASNDGIAEPELDFVAESDEYVAVIADTGLLLDVDGTDEPIEMTLADSDAAAPTAASGESAVAFDDVYPGIDAVYSANGPELEYSFIVEPGADVAEISLDFDGVRAVRIADNGDLVLESPDGPDLLSTAPFTYQFIDGIRVTVPSDYEIRGDGSVGFTVGPYDPTRSLVIDPTFRSAAGVATGGSTTVTIARPEGLLPNDVMIAAIAQSNNSAVTPPAGWTFIRRDIRTAALSQDLYYRVAGASEPASYQWTLGISSEGLGSIVSYGGIDTTAPIDAHGGQSNSSSTSYTAPSITTSSTDTILVAAFAKTSSNAVTPPAGMTERVELSTNSVLHEIADEQRSAAGATGTRTATGASNSNIGQLVALRKCSDSDADGLCDRDEDTNADADNNPATNPGPDTDGDTLPNYLDADDDGDGMPTASENADPNADGDPRDALDSDHDGQPDWLDTPVTASTSGTADSEQKISSTTGGLTPSISNNDEFGTAVSGIGDIDGDGVNDVVVGAESDDDGGTDRGSVRILFLNPDGTVKGGQSISDTQGGLSGSLSNSSYFGIAAIGLGDLDGDGFGDIAVGADFDDDGGSNRGAVFILFLNPDGTVKDEQKISDTQGGFATTLGNEDRFGYSLGSIGDLDGNGINDIAVGAYADDDGGTDRGAVYILLLNADGTVKAEQKISDTQGGFTSALDNVDRFGSGVAGLGDLDGDGTNDIIVGARYDDDGGTDRGAAYVLFLNPDGTVGAEQKISDTQGGLTTTLANSDKFGISVASLGDIDGDNVIDVVVGADGTSSTRGAVHVLFLNIDGTVKGGQKIGQGAGGFGATLDSADQFGLSTAGLGDLDGDGTVELIIGAIGDDDGGSNRGAAYVLHLAASTPPNTIVVNSTADSADANAGNGSCDTGGTNSEGAPRCTLRAAIQEANASGLVDTIEFDIPQSDGGYTASPESFTIRPSTLLPTISTAMVIDASTQPEYATNNRPVIELDGSNVSSGEENGFYLTGGGSTIRGFVINNWGDDGIDIEFNGDNTIVGNYVGTNVTGTVAEPNAWGINFKTGDNTIGGTTAGDRNVVSGNSNDGFYVRTSSATGNMIQGNYIGTNAAGTGAIANGKYGIYIFGSANGNTIGGATAAHGNVISGNGTGEGGILIDGSATSGNIIQHNLIGTNAAGDAALPNNLHGITIDDAPGTQVLDNLISGNDVHGLYINDTGASATQVLGNTIGTNLAADAPLPNTFDGVRIEGWANGATIGATGNGNIISGNGQRGINLNNSNSNTIQSNFIGTNAGGAVDLGNTSSGVYNAAFGSSDNLVGGNLAGDGNTIAFNGEGITFVSGTDNAILGNQIYANDSLGIDFDDDGATANSNVDAWVNFPENLSATSTGGTVTVDFDLDLPAGDYRIEVFSNPSGADGSGYGEGENYENSLVVSHTGSGSESFQISYLGSDGDVVTLTATEQSVGPDYGATSEFSLAATATSLTDSDGDGLWDHEEDANTDTDDDPATNPGPDTDGDTLPNYLDADDDDDGELTSSAAEAADPNGDGDPRDALDVDHDGEPDYLDQPLDAFDFTVRKVVRLADNQGGMGALPDSSQFGSGATAIGDLNGDGVEDLMIGSDASLDALWTVFMNTDGTASSVVRLDGTEGAIDPLIQNNGGFGWAPSSIGDLDGDGRPEIMVGLQGDDTGATGAGAVLVLFMNTDGTVANAVKIANGTGGFGGTVAASDGFFRPVTHLGDVDGDGIPDAAVAAIGADDGGSNRGAVWILFMNSDGTVRAEQKISSTTGGFTGPLANGDQIGRDLGSAGDVDGDGVPDLFVGTRHDTDGGALAGAVWLVLLNSDGTVKSDHKYGGSTPGLTSTITAGSSIESATSVGDLDGDGISDFIVGGVNNDALHLVARNNDHTVKSVTTIDASTLPLWSAGEHFGHDVQSIGDIDDNGVVDLAIGTWGVDDGGTDRGALFVLLMGPCDDADGDGLCDLEEDANTDADDDPATNPGPDTDGDTLPNYLDADDDDDGELTSSAAEAADPNGDGDPRDALDSDRDGQPDYLDVPTNAASGTVGDEQKISSTAGGLTGPLDNDDLFGRSVSAIGDLDGDGVADLAVGARADDDGGAGRGAIYILFLNADGTVKAEQKISDTVGGFGATLDDYDAVGVSVSGIGDLDGDGIPDIATGAFEDDDGGSNSGAVYILFLNADGTVKAEQKISSLAGGLTGPVDSNDLFGSAVSGIGDLDGDGIPDIAVGARYDGDGGTNSGAVYVLLLNADGTVRTEQKISRLAGGLAASIDDSDEFGHSVSGIGDLDGDGLPDIAVGAVGDNDGGPDRGAIHVLFLNVDGTVKAEQKISQTTGGLTGPLNNADYFGMSVSGIGDVDQDGAADIVVGAQFDDDGGTNRGAAYVLFLNTDGTVKAEQKISDTVGGFAAPLDDSDQFGSAVSGIGDLDGDGTIGLAVGALGDGDGGSGRGAIYVLDLSTSANIDSDGDGLWDAEEDANTDADDDPATNPGPDTDGDTLPNYLDADDDDDGELTSSAAEAADPNGDGDPRDALDSDHDGQPDYLDVPTGKAVPEAIEHTKISSAHGGLVGPLNASDSFGGDASSIGDVDGDGIVDMVVGAHLDDDGATSTGAVYILFLNADGSVRAEQKISATQGGLAGPLDGGDNFGSGVGGIGDLDGDGIPDIVVGASQDGDGGSNRGAAHIVFLNADGTVKVEQKISSTTGGLTSPLDDDDGFGGAAAGIGDLDGDGIPDIAIGAAKDDDGGSNRGALYVLFMNEDGTVKAEQKISSTTGGLTGPLDNTDYFGISVTEAGDLDGDGITDLATGAYFDADGGSTRGAVYILFMNSDGTVRAEQKISSLHGGAPKLEDGDWFGYSVGGLGDVDLDGVDDLLVGSMLDDDGGSSSGAAYILLMNSDGTVKSPHTLSARTGQPVLEIDPGDQFGTAATGLGDLDGDGAPSLAVGARSDDDGGSGRGAVYVFDLAILVDTDGDGLWDIHEDQNADRDGNPATNASPNTDGDANANYLDADDDGDGALTSSAAEAADPNGDGDPRDARDSDRDGEPDYLDVPTIATNPRVLDEQKISSSSGGLTATLTDGEELGRSVEAIGDLDGDGIVDLAAGRWSNDDGGLNRGAVEVLFLNTDGTIKAEQTISDLTGGFDSALDDEDEFGHGLAVIGDLDGDGIADLAVGAHRDDDGGTDRGAVFVLFMNSNGTVRAERKISSSTGDLTSTLADGAQFGHAIEGIGDLNGDGHPDIAVGARLDPGSGFDRGAIHILFLDSDGSVLADQKISESEGGLTAGLANEDRFGMNIGALGDVDGDGVIDLAVGAPGDDDGGTDRGAIYILFLNSDGTVKDEQKVSNTVGGLITTSADLDEFGAAISGLGDLDLDGVPDALAGVRFRDDGGTGRGTALVLLLNSDGTVKQTVEINELVGGFSTSLDDDDGFGAGVTALGDLDGDGTIGLAVGAPGDDDGGTDRGAIYVLDLEPFVRTLVVNSTGDSGDAVPGDGLCDTGALNSEGDAACTLRAALEETNAAGTSTITFAMPATEAGHSGGVWTLSPTTPFDDIVVPVTIDGSTQLGWATTPVVQIDGSGAGSAVGLLLASGADGSEIRSLAIGNFTNGAIDIHGDDNLIAGNHFGVDAAGTALTPVGNVPVVNVDGGANNTIGGGTAADRNVIGSGDYGIVVDNGASDTAIFGNYIGTNTTLSPSYAFRRAAIRVQNGATRVAVGGVNPGEGNTFKYGTFGYSSIEVVSAATDDVSILGNQILNDYGAIDLDGDGPTANDPLDADGGANDLLNHPTIAVTNTTGAGPYTVDLDVTLDVPAGDYRIEVFANEAPGLAGVGMAEQLVHAFTVSHTGSGDEVFSTSYTDTSFNALSATATEEFGGGAYGSTSEMSPVATTFGQTMVVNSTRDIGDSDINDGLCLTGATNSAGDPECTLRAAIEQANRTYGTTIEFSIPTGDAGYNPDGFWTIAPGADLDRLYGPDTTIDGWTQPGFDASRPVIYIRDNSSGLDLLSIRADDITVSWLSLGHPGDDAVQVEGDRVTLDGLWVGIDPLGADVGGPTNGNEGVIVYDGSTDVQLANSRVSGFDSGVLSNSGTVEFTVTNSAVFGNRNGGIVFSNSGRVTALGNSIHDNIGLGIDLGPTNGVPLPNDVGDGDTGSNDLLNHPELNSATIGAGTLNVSYDLDVPAGTYRIEFFANTRPSPTGHGEGETFVASATIAHAGGSASYVTGIPGADGDVITATATPDLGGGSYGGTSEFSNALAVGVVFVNSTGDTGDLALGDGNCDTGGVNSDGFTECTLRAAMEEAVSNTAIDRIRFAIPATDGGYTAGSPGHWTIAPATSLPYSTDIIEIDASTQPGWTGDPLIELDGNAVATIGSDGLRAADGMTIRGFSITRWIDEGVHTDADNTVFSANWFGIAPDGTPRPNQEADLVVWGAADGTRIGGPNPEDGNVFAAGGIQDGAVITDDATNTTVQHNFFGVANDGITPLNTVTAELLSMNANSSFILVSDNQFGGSPDAAIVVFGNSTDVTVTSNTFGTDDSGIAVLPVGSAVYSETTGTVRFGGTTPAEWNTVRNVLHRGVFIDTGQTGAFSYLGNSMAGSGVFGLDLGGDGITLNDDDDIDGGPNGLLNFPDITSVTETGGTVRVAYGLDVPAGTYRIEAFTNPSGAHSTGYGEGELFQTADTVVHAGAGRQTYELTFAGAIGDLVSMTATEDLGGGSYGATSEFSRTVAATDPVLDLTADRSIRRSDVAAGGGISVVSDSEPGRAGTALRFDGTNDRLIGPALDITDSALTMRALFNADTLSGDPRLISKRTSGGTSIYELSIDSATTEVVATLRLGGSAIVAQGGVTTSGTWHDALASWDGAELVLYVDGAEVDRVPAIGALANDLTTDVIIGNTTTNSGPFDGLIDDVRISHESTDTATAEALSSNLVAASFVDVGGEQTATAGSWTTSSVQTRSGSFALAAPETSGSGAAAWARATGIDEPGLAFESWWWFSTDTGIDLASGTRAGNSPTDEYEAALTSPSGWELRQRIGGSGSFDAPAAGSPTTGAWVHVEIRTDQFRDTRLFIDGSEVTTATPQGSALLSGSMALRVGLLPTGENWYVDDARGRKLVTPEPVVTVGPLDRD